MTTTTTQTASERITAAVTAWPGVQAGVGDRGEFGFRVGRHEIGHLHGDRTAHFGFPPDLGARLRAEGRVGPHPIAPDKPAWAARPIAGEADVEDVVALMRLNYDRLLARPRFVAGLYPTAPQPLPFAPDLHVRAFLLQREAGNLLVYSTGRLGEEARELERRGGVARRYLNHGHEALFPSPEIAAPVFVHAADRDAVAGRLPVRATFTRRHTLGDDFAVIPTPGHTPGATAFLWTTGEHRALFTGDTIHLHDGEWATAVLASSDRAAYARSLELIRELDFDVLVPWAATAGGPVVALTDREDTRRRIDALLAGLR